MRRAWVLALLGAGCAGSDEPPAPVPLEAFSRAAAGAVCDFATRCRHVPDREVCERMLDPKRYDTRRAEDAVAAGRLAYEPRAAGACLAATAAAHCLVSPLTDESCGRMFRGLLAEGEACTSDFECDRARCDELTCPDQCCAGVCGPPSPPPEPPPPRAEVGEACESHPDCVPEAYCEEDRRCAPSPEEEGARCLFGCAPGDLFCDIETLTCRRYAAAGDPCDEAGEAHPPCNPAWSFCDGVCRLLPGPGEPCEEEDRRCIPTSFCNADRAECIPRGGEGAPCEAHAHCEVACIEGTCAAYETCVAP